MAVSHHGRSLSFPSGSHPDISLFDETLFRVRSSKASCTSLSKTNNNVNTLKSLYNNIDDLLMLPHIQHIISVESQKKWIEQILDGYIQLLDACSSAKDLVSQTKQDVQELLSALRRKDVQGIHRYLACRTRSKKTVQKSLKNLRSFRNKNNVFVSDKDNETMSIAHVLKESESVSFGMLESLLSYVVGTKGQSSSTGWSLVSKLMQPKKVSCQDTDINEFKKIDVVLKMSQEADVQDEFMYQLKNMDSSIQSLEEELECLFRQLIKTRVFLLNILNN